VALDEAACSLTAAGPHVPADPAAGPDLAAPERGHRPAERGHAQDISVGGYRTGPTAVAGIYGMNFENTLELRWQSGYFLILGLIVAVCLGLYVLFRRNGWL
jgi:CorA-like Mg2+ transporter protein